MVDASTDLSVIIPTTGQRVPLLARAVASAVTGMGSMRVEVLVVLNGGAPLAWTPVHPQVRLVEIAQKNVCAARNAGLERAQGRFVRFLDDDDFLLPEIAVRQYRQATEETLDISSFAIRSEDDQGRTVGLHLPPTEPDFCTAQLGPGRMQLTHAHLYRREYIQSCRWTEAFKVSEDIAWLHSIAAVATDARWAVSKEVVGVWYQHGAPRASFARAAHEPHANTARSITQLVGQLEASGRLSPPRAAAAAAGLWDCAHRAFYRHPLYWHKIARLAQRLQAGSKPSDPFFQSGVGRAIGPLATEWMMVPKRWANECVRDALRLRRGTQQHTRTL